MCPREPQGRRVARFVVRERRTGFERRSRRRPGLERAVFLAAFYGDLENRQVALLISAGPPCIPPCIRYATAPAFAWE